MKSNDKTIGSLIRTMRKERDITQKELGEIIGVSERVVGYYETDNRFPKDKEVIVRIAEFFNVSVDYLLQNSDIKNPYKEAPEGKDDSIANEYQTTIKRQDDLQQIIDLVRDYCNEYVIRDCDEKEALIAIYNLVPRKEIKLEGSKKQNKKEQKLKADFMDMWLDFYKSQKQDRD